MNFVHNHTIRLRGLSPRQANFAKVLLLTTARGLLGPEGETWSVETSRKAIIFRFADLADLIRLERRFDQLELGERCDCASHPCICNSWERGVGHAA